MSITEKKREFAQLAVGEEFETYGRTITEADVVSFAALTADWHPQHSDARWAADGDFGERIAHGMLVVSYALGLARANPERVIALRRISDATFKRPVRLGDTIRVRGTVTRVRPVDGDVSIVECDWKVLNQDHRCVVRLTIEALWRDGERISRRERTGRFREVEPELVCPPL